MLLTDFQRLCPLPHKASRNPRITFVGSSFVYGRSHQPHGEAWKHSRRNTNQQTEH